MAFAGHVGLPAFLILCWVGVIAASNAVDGTKGTQVELGPHRCAGRLDFGCVYPDGRSVRSRPLVGNGEEDGPTPIKRMRSHFIGKLAGRHDRILAKTKRAMRGGNGAVDPSSRRAKLSDGLHTLFEVVLYHSDGCGPIRTICGSCRAACLRSPERRPASHYEQ